MANDISTLNHVIEVLNDGKKFYQECVVTEVQRPDLKTLFSQMATTKLPPSPPTCAPPSSPSRCRQGAGCR